VLGREDGAGAGAAPPSLLDDCFVPLNHFVCNRRASKAPWSAANGGTADFPTEKQIVNMDLPEVDFKQWTDMFGTGDAAKDLIPSGSATFKQFAEAVHMLNMYRKTPSTGNIWRSELAAKLKI